MSEVLNIDAILDAATLPERDVPLCLNGAARREYEEVAVRIRERDAEREAARESKERAARLGGIVDDRLGVKTGTDVDGNPPPAPDEEQEMADLLLSEVHRHTVVFRLTAIPDEDWSAMLAKHPPRTLPDGRRDPRDVQDGVNVDTFFPELIKRSLILPKLDDAQYEKLRRKLSASQVSALNAAAGQVNTGDESVPFWPSASGSPQS